MSRNLPNTFPSVSPSSSRFSCQVHLYLACSSSKRIHLSWTNIGIGPVTKHGNIVRRLILILLSIKILMDFRISNQVNQFMKELVPVESMPAFLARCLIGNVHPSESAVAHPHPSTYDHHEYQPRKRVSDFVAYLLWIVLIKLEFF